MKTLNRYSGLITIMLIVIGMYGSYVSLAQSVKDSEVALANHRKESKQMFFEIAQQIREDVNISKEIIQCLREQSIHQKYLKEAFRELAQATREQTKETAKLNTFLDKIQKVGYVEISKKGGL